MRKLLPAIFLLIVSTFAQAQQSYLILKAGATSSHLKGMAYADLEEERHTGFMGGAALELGLTKNNFLAFQPELLFVQKGGKLQDTKGDSFAQSDESYTIHYLEIPVLLKATLGNNALKLFLTAGPSVGIGAGGKHTYEDGFYRGSESKVVFSKPKDKNTVIMQLSPRLDVSLLAGGGISYTLGNIRLMLEGRYGLGLKPIENKYLQENRIYNYKELHNRFLLINAGVGIPLAK